jgi:KRAB domain-containing zinc finger protein
MKRTHETGKYKCSFCSKNFHQISILKDHVAQHSGQKIHQCRVCEKTFRNAGRKRLHERKIHSDEYEKNLKPIYLRGE